MLLEKLLINLQQEFLAATLWGREVRDPLVKIIDSAIIIARVEARLSHSFLLTVCLPIQDTSQIQSVRAVRQLTALFMRISA